MSDNMTLSCLFSRYIVNKSKSEYPETIATYGLKKKTETFVNFHVMLSVLMMVSVFTGQSGMNSFTNARYVIRVPYKLLRLIPCQLESWPKTPTQAPTCSLLRQEKKARTPKPSERVKLGLRLRTKII